MKKQKKLLKKVKVHSQDDGFTFAETVAVLAIMLILSASIGVSAYKYVDHAKNLTARNQIMTYKMALNAYYLDCGVYPSSEQGLNALWEKPTLYPVPKNWDGPYIDSQVKCDPWGNDFQYKNTAKEKSSYPFEIVSYGADGISGGVDGDDVLSWNL